MYEPTNWKSGDVVTSAKLNKLEQGVAGASNFLVVTVQQVGYGGTFNKTAVEVFEAFPLVIVETGTAAYLLTEARGDDEGYHFRINNGVIDVTFNAAGDDDYPTAG